MESMGNKPYSNLECPDCGELLTLGALTDSGTLLLTLLKIFFKCFQSPDFQLDFSSNNQIPNKINIENSIKSINTLNTIYSINADNNNNQSIKLIS